MCIFFWYQLSSIEARSYAISKWWKVPTKCKNMLLNPVNIQRSVIKKNLIGSMKVRIFLIFMNFVITWCFHFLLAACVVYHLKYLRKLKKYILSIPRLRTLFQFWWHANKQWCYVSIESCVIYRSWRKGPCPPFSPLLSVSASISWNYEIWLVSDKFFFCF